VRNRKAARVGGRTPFEKHALVIDRFFETKRQALAWANSHPAFMPIRIVRPNSSAVAVQSLHTQNQPLLIPRAQVAASNRSAKTVAARSGSSDQLIASSGSSSRTTLIRMGR
jgi:hypothetical protein